VGDLNAKVGTKLDGEDEIVGEHGLQSERKDNDECLLEHIPVLLLS
jgi:hypothetical protein